VNDSVDEKDFEIENISVAVKEFVLVKGLDKLKSLVELNVPLVDRVPVTEKVSVVVNKLVTVKAPVSVKLAVFENAPVKVKPLVTEKEFDCVTVSLPE
jgi:hypothetical protein